MPFTTEKLYIALASVEASAFKVKFEGEEKIKNQLKLEARLIKYFKFNLALQREIERSG